MQEVRENPAMGAKGTLSNAGAGLSLKLYCQLKAGTSRSLVNALLQIRQYSIQYY